MEFRLLRAGNPVIIHTDIFGVEVFCVIEIGV